ncbi:hypothetical protein E3E12_04275 [Formicincola oecophyllae]|uniref:Uncharacterized protein n=1 Tax=Formicincola oecophyllae TaxID=2558361 RepID=A0A4Y6U957_9PROT|nr:hypothetical protein [Formicincola oecophyllae]QDH13540.1 hypothetical protein E3E12_04275 [Formicincola oecophyllae]
MTETALWRPASPERWGEVHDVRLVKLVPEWGGGFVRLVDGAEGFLTLPRSALRPNTPSLTEGQCIRAEIIRSPQQGKGLRLKPQGGKAGATTAVQPALVSKPPNPIAALALHAPQAPLRIDAAWAGALLREQLPSTALPPGRLALVGDAFGAEGRQFWQNLLSPTIQVGPLTAHITLTPALLAVDLDGPKPDFNSNREAFAPLLRQLRLRHLAGVIMVDPAGLPLRKRFALAPFLQSLVLEENAITLGPERFTGLSVTKGGLIELARTRTQTPLQELAATDHGQALAILDHILRANLPGNVLILAAPLHDALLKDQAALETFHRQRAPEWSAKPLTLQRSESLAQGGGPTWQLGDG